MTANEQNRYCRQSEQLGTDDSDKKKYSHVTQVQQIREKLIQPLGLRLVDMEKQIIHEITE